jgi:Putative Ig domain
MPERSLGDIGSTMKGPSAAAKTPFGRIDRALLLIGLLVCAGCSRSADVTIQPARTFQTIAGWGHGSGVVGAISRASTFLPQSVANAVSRQYLDYLVDDLGLTGTRTPEVGPRLDGAATDHGDCDVVDWTLFEGGSFSPSDAALLVYYQNRILAEGFQPLFYSSPGYPTHASERKPWVLNDPCERAQQIWASAYYLKTRFGINIAYAVIYNEPSMPWTILRDDINALGPRLAAHGLTTLVQYAETISPQTGWNYIAPAANDPGMWRYVGRISYHNYGSADPYRSRLRDFAAARSLTTAQTEMENPTFEDLYQDLTLAGVTYWEVGYNPDRILVSSPALTTFAPSPSYFRLRQLMHYVRPGAIRIGTASSNPSVRVLVFSRSGAITTIIENIASSGQKISLSGLAPGRYGLSVAHPRASSFRELGPRTVGAGGTLTLADVAGGTAVTTLYPLSGQNHPPTIEVWSANPGYLVAPSKTVKLSVTASDPELDPLTFHWSITSEPAGANAHLTSPDAATTTAAGLSVPGTYVFNVDVYDGTSHSSQQVYLVAYGANPPPVLGQTGFRIAPPYGLVFGDPRAATHARIELPTSSVTLQAGIADIANSDFTGRGTWRLVSQPGGAHAVVSGTTYLAVSLRAEATNMTVTGDYIFQINVTNPGHPDLVAQVVCTVSPATSAPVIGSIMASPPHLVSPATMAQLSATTSGSANQLLRHWWAVKSAPVGAEPSFDHQGMPNTTVGNLTLPGTYEFTLRVFDDLHMSTRDLSLTVNPAPGAPIVTSAVAVSVIAGTPLSYTVAASGSPTGFTALGLPPGLTFGNGIISGTLARAGTYNILLSATNVGGVGYGNLALTVIAPP